MDYPTSAAGGASGEEVTTAFRQRFQVPEEAVSIADRICQKRHHDWIEAYLGNLQPAQV